MPAAHEPAQLALGLPEEQPSETALREAFDAYYRGRKTFPEAMNDPALYICLKHLAWPIERRLRKRRKEPA